MTEPVLLHLNDFCRLESLTSQKLGWKWGDALRTLAPDLVHEGVTYLGLERAPAGKGNHHAFIGGLVHHMLEMWDFWELLKPNLPPDPLLTDVRILKGILVHDLHKAWATFVLDPAVDSGLNYGKHPSEGMFTHLQKTLYLVMRLGLDLDAVDFNALCCSEGGWAENHPKWGSTVGKLLYLLDELSGNVKARAEQGNILDVRAFNTNLSLIDFNSPQ